MQWNMMYARSFLFHTTQSHCTVETIKIITSSYSITETSNTLLRKTLLYKLIYVAIDKTLFMLKQVHIKAFVNVNQYFLSLQNGTKFCFLKSTMD